MQESFIDDGEKEFLRGKRKRQTLGGDSTGLKRKKATANFKKEWWGGIK